MSEHTKKKITDPVTADEADGTWFEPSRFWKRGYDETDVDCWLDRVIVTLDRYEKKERKLRRILSEIEGHLLNKKTGVLVREAITVLGDDSVTHEDLVRLGFEDEVQEAQESENSDVHGLDASESLSLSDDAYSTSKNQDQEGGH